MLSWLCSAYCLWPLPCSFYAAPDLCGCCKLTAQHPPGSSCPFLELYAFCDLKKCLKTTQGPHYPPVLFPRGAPVLVPSCLQLRLNAQQLDEKRAAEAAVEEIKELIDAATSESSKEQLSEELTARQAKLDELMAGFEVRTGRVFFQQEGCRVGFCGLAAASFGCLSGARYAPLTGSSLCAAQHSTLDGWLQQVAPAGWGQLEAPLPYKDSPMQVARLQLALKLKVHC